jgi:plastocyanin
MTWQSLTFFKKRPLLRGLFLSLVAVNLASAGAVSGRVELRDSQDASVRKRMDFSGVVVWLEPVNGAPAPAPPGVIARMIQKDKTFTPHVLPIRAGTRVDFPNFDPIFHNAFSNYNGEQFDVGLYPPGTSRPMRFSQPGIVRVFCNIHANMSAVIVVLNTPYFGATQKNGNYQLQDVPPGEYSLRFFHERATQTTLDSLTRRVTVVEGNITLPAVAISESGYIVIPHHNKYGHDYTSPPDDDGVYPAVRK